MQDHKWFCEKLFNFMKDKLIDFYVWFYKLKVIDIPSRLKKEYFKCIVQLTTSKLKASYDTKYLNIFISLKCLFSQRSIKFRE